MASSPIKAVEVKRFKAFGLKTVHTDLIGLNEISFSVPYS